MRLSRAVATPIIEAIDALYTLLARWRVFKNLLSPTIFRYAVCGVVNYFLLDTTLYYLLYHYIIRESFIYIAGVAVSPHISSLIILFPITLLNGFWLNRNVAFKANAHPAGRQFIVYIGTIAGSLALSYFVMKLLVEGCGMWATPAKLTTSVVTSVYSYLSAKFITFK